MCASDNRAEAPRRRRGGRELRTQDSGSQFPCTAKWSQRESKKVRTARPNLLKIQRSQRVAKLRQPLRTNAPLPYRPEGTSIVGKN